MTLPALAWQLLTRLAAPLLPWHLARRARRGKEIPARLEERRGGGAQRPEGRLFWLHAASVGEALSALPVLEALLARDPALHLLVTTGTVTGAESLARRLPQAFTAPGPDGLPRIAHRFLPLDVPAFVARFLDGWRPDAGALVESELWPNLLRAARARNLPMALVNARVSPRSFARWRRLPRTVAELLGGFRLVLARSEADRARLLQLGASSAQCWGDLKAAAPPLPADPAALERLRGLLGDRPVFLAASTHPGEETLALAAHALLAPAWPELLTVLVPRHPDRGAAVAEQAAKLGLTVARRSAGGAPGDEVSVYVADTLGELGLFYRLAGVALVGGSLVPHGGQNPLEAARLGCPILLGPHTFNFEEPVARLLAAGGARLVAAEAGALAEQVEAMLSDAARRHAMAAAAAQVAEGQASLPGMVAAALLDLIDGERAQGDCPGG
ncbi:3-deoxy-D-manno-octulosonic acid transferase [Falsiroseomonas tokyonensis]|uniref:3-deoxy-D-manno-octulosonic acid transferase n=1 Tax=Falsiroseomonas tokyonensis TaxID=430521 RepID=A0ABV7BVM8_9PROT|nr:3-deoxy-D-manno-octulosonic acid transferase [Falsiroseomonas tokyonensis]MBU8539325.1 3-deoxy-D-manno-octulosonic acid transferase [Falsiroseomonas tokyonensis]